MPVEVTVELLKRAMLSRIHEAQAEKKTVFLIDGFPRSLHQALAFEQALQVKPARVISLEVVSEETLLQRILGRGANRADDNVVSARKRFVTFREMSVPVVEHYEHCQEVRVLRISAEKSPTEVQIDFLDALKG